MENHPTRAVVLESNCPKYAPGDAIVFEGAFVDKNKSGELCMVALSAIYPFLYAARRGGSVKDGPVQCPDCGECVKFRLERLD